MGERVVESLRHLSQRMPRITSLRLREEYYCHICLAHQPVSEAYALATCRHRFCRDCLRGYVDVCLSHGKVDLKCHFILPDAPPPSPGQHGEQDGGKHDDAGADRPRGGEAKPQRAGDAQGEHATGRVAPPDTCGALLTEADVRELVSEQQLQRWRRFVANRDPNMRQCPNCDASQRGSAAQPAMTCTACGLQFCFAHSNAHPARTCADFERELLQQEREAMQVINAISVRCPGCQAAVEKASGCNHMRCPNCATYFCYLCGQRVSSSALPNHYAFWNLAGCPNRQMSESARPWSMCESVLYRLGYALLLLIFGPPALALTLCSMVLCCPLVCIGVRSSWNMEESQGVLRQDATPVARENGAGGDLQEVVVVASEEQLSTPAPATAKPAPPPQPSTCSKLGSIFAGIFTAWGYVLMAVAVALLAFPLLVIACVLSPCIGCAVACSSRKAQRASAPAQGAS